MTKLFSTRLFSLAFKPIGDQEDVKDVKDYPKGLGFLEVQYMDVWEKIS